MGIIEGGIGPYQYAGDPTTQQGSDAVQTVVLTGTPTAGAYKLQFESSQTADLAFNADAAAVQAALEALPNLGVGNVTAAAGAVGSTVVTFTGTKGKQPVQPLTVASSTLDAGATLAVEQTTPGVAPSGVGSAKGALLIDTENGKLYQNEGTAAAPTWVAR
jgi:hypothetical protein